MKHVRSRDGTTIAYDRRARGDSGDTAPYAVEREIAQSRTLARQTHNVSAKVLAPVLVEFFAGGIGN